MLKWLVQRKSISGSIEGLDEIDRMSHSEGELSPCSSVGLDDIYESFNDSIEKRESPSVTDVDYTDVFIVSPQRNRHVSRDKNEQRNQSASSSNILSSIEEGIEYDELGSIADSGISCDDEYDFELDPKSKYNTNESSTSEEDNGDLLSCIRDELIKRTESISLPDNNKNDSNNIRERTTSETNTFNEYHKPSFPPKPKHLKSTSSEEESTQSLSKESSSNHTIEDMDNLLDTTEQYQLSDIDLANNQIFSRLKLKANLNNSTINGTNSKYSANAECPLSLM